MLLQILSGLQKTKKHFILVWKFDDITNKIIPFFPSHFPKETLEGRGKKYLITGVKAQDFQDWCKVWN